jgi:hypothetical protein
MKLEYILEKWAGVAKNSSNKDVEFFENPTPKEVREDLYNNGNNIVPVLIDRKTGKIITWKEAGGGYLLHNQMAKHLGKSFKNFLPIYAMKNGNVELTGDNTDSWIKSHTDYKDIDDYERFEQDVKRLVLDNRNLKVLVGSNPKFLNYKRIKDALEYMTK